MKMNKCKKCGLEFEPFHYYVQLESGEFMDEQCFFDYALEQLNAKSVHNDYRGEIETPEEEYDEL